FCSSHQPGLNSQPWAGGETDIVSRDGRDVNKNHARFNDDPPRIQAQAADPRTVLKSISFLHGGKPDVIQPNLPRNEIVELLAGQADKPNNDQFGLWPSREIQEQRGPSVARAGQIVSEFIKGCNIV